MTGLRRFEVAKIDIRDIDFERSTLRVIGKGNKEGLVPLLPELLSNIKHYVGTRKEGWLFPSKINRDKHISNTRINIICRNCGRLAGVNNPNPRLKHINPHIFRHSLVRFLKEKGVSIETIKNIVRHSSSSTTMDMYGTKSFEDVRKEFEGAYE